MVPSLEKFDAVPKHFIDESIGVTDPPRPHITTEVLQVFWLANPHVRIPENGVHQVQDPECDLPVGVYPVPQILQAFILEDGLPSARHP